MKSTYLAVAVLALAIGAVGLWHHSAHAQAADSSQAAAAQVDAARLVNADKEPGNWMVIGRTYGDQRFSPLDKINASNAGNLGLAWYYDLETSRGQEATPLVVDGVMYVSTAWSLVKAFDAKTGALKWSYDPEVPREILINICCDAVNRGVAVWKGKVYVGTLDGRLIALDAATGKPVWSVQTVDKTKPYTITSAPLVTKDKVLIGNSGSEYGVRGYISAYDAESGKLVWRFYTVPGDPSKPFESPIMAKAAKTWHGKWWELGGGGTVWSPISYDPDLDYVYFATANGVEWDQKDRSPGGGDNLFLASIIAVKASTGEYVWDYQVVPGDVWDYDTTQNMILANLTINGRARKVLMQAAKDGFFYVLDRQTGELLSANPFVPVNWATGIDLKTGRPIENPKARYDKTGKQITITPAPLGGHNWQPMAFSPQTGLVYIPAQEEKFPFIREAGFEESPIGPNLGIDISAASIPKKAAARKAAWKSEKGFLLAWDPVRQKEVWRVNYRGPWNGGVLTTAGNLVVQGSAAGDFAVYRADNGEKLWSMPVQTAVIAAPMTYEVDGEQYIGVLAGWGGGYAIVGGELSNKSGNQRNISRVLAFKLGGKATLPPAPPQPARVLNPPPQTASAATVQRGKELYGRFCLTCHGVDAASGGLVPDLRYSKLLTSDIWFDVVLDGAMKKDGMVGFAQVLDRHKAAEIRSYVIERANNFKARAGENYASAP